MSKKRIVADQEGDDSAREGKKTPVVETCCVCKQVDRDGQEMWEVQDDFILFERMPKITSVVSWSILFGDCGLAEA